ncbi:MAG: anthranilate synthase component II [Planctomycetota bacterium]
MILVLDNYDSFTYNLVQALGELGATLKVFRNDRITVEEATALSPERLIISPGPCTPSEAGVSCALIQHFAGRIPILGVCLGHQSIAQAYGGEVIRAEEPVHGKTSEVTHDGRGVYRGLSSPFTATRYHSLVVREESLPACLMATSHTVDGQLLMGIRHRELAVEGVQFHPESFLTLEGQTLLKNFLEL